VRLISSDDIAPIAADIFSRVSTQLRGLLPDAELHHIGATAIPGALTKGDLDVLVRVDRVRFQPARDLLRGSFEVKQPQNWDAHFASFGSDAGYALPVGVQLVVKESEADFFLFVHEYILSHPDILATYNRVKQEYADESPAEYWSAKDRVLAPIVALRVKAHNVCTGNSRPLFPRDENI
jgi:GrpB-like predicted nucleotidyltransferase (UPF0157 family)